MRLYIAGPMTGLPGHNLPAFAAAATGLDTRDYVPVNPGRHGADPTSTWVDYMRRGIADLITCEGVAVLDGWERSRGAILEVHIARALGLPVQHLSRWLAGQVAA